MAGGLVGGGFVAVLVGGTGVFVGGMDVAVCVGLTVFVGLAPGATVRGVKDANM